MFYFNIKKTQKTKTKLLNDIYLKLLCDWVYRVFNHIWMIAALTKQHHYILQLQINFRFYRDINIHNTPTKNIAYKYDKGKKIQFKYLNLSLNTYLSLFTSGCI